MENSSYILSLILFLLFWPYFVHESFEHKIFFYSRFMIRMNILFSKFMQLNIFISIPTDRNKEKTIDITTSKELIDEARKRIQQNKKLHNKLFFVFPFLRTNRNNAAAFYETTIFILNKIMNGKTK